MQEVLLVLAGVVAGWVVFGAQAASATVTAERREVYRRLVLEADTLALVSDGPRRSDELDQLETHADLVSSQLMRRANGVTRFTAAVGRPGWARERDRFVRLARVEGLSGSVLVRLWRWKLYMN